MLPASTASAATSPTTTTLPMTSFDQIVADTARGHLFFSEGSPDYSPTSGTGSILVTSLDGKTVTTITGLPGVKSLALSPDGSTLYAAVAGANEIAAISTTTLKVTRTYGTDSDIPLNLTFEDGILWIGYSVGGYSNGIGYINPAATSPAFTPQALPGFWYYPPFIAGDPSNASATSTTGTLVAYSAGESPTPVYSFQISGTTVTSSDSAYLSNFGGPLEVLPGGAQFLAGASIYDTTDLSAGAEGAYVGGASSTAIAPDGMIAFGYSYDEATWGAGITTFPAGSMTADPSQGYSGFGDADSYPAGMAWSADSSELFAVITQTNSGGEVTGYTLQTLYPPTPYLQPFPLTLTTSTGTIAYKGTAELTVTSGITHDSNEPPIYIYETPAGGQRKLFAKDTNVSGWTTSYNLSQFTTSTSFTASIAGDSEYAGVTTAPVTVNVYASVGESLSGYYTSKVTDGETYRVYHHTTTLKDDATVAPNKRGECVKLEIQHGTATGWKASALTGCTSLNSSSKATLAVSLSKYSIGGKYRVRVDYIRSSKDTANLSTDAGWQYIIVEK
jgi:hypothetical protein